MKSGFPMRISRFKDQRVVGVLRVHDAGTSVDADSLASRAKRYEPQADRKCASPGNQVGG